MKVLFPCPSCHRLLQPPIQASGSARLRCPLCQHEILAYDLVQGAQRPWMVIEDSGGEDLFSEFQEDESPAQRIHDDGFEYRLSEPDQDSKSLTESPNPDSETSGDLSKKGHSIQWDKFKPITHDEFQRRRRASKSPIASLLQVVFGGLAAIPISLLILWYGLGKDVAEAGPWVAQYAPWIVPQKFHRNRPFERDWQPSNSEPAMGEFSNLSKFDPSDSGEPSKEKGSNASEIIATKTEVEPTTNKPLPEKLDSTTPRFSELLQQWDRSSSEWLEFDGDDAEKNRVQRNYLIAATNVAKLLPKMDRRSASEKVWLDKCNQMLRDQGNIPNLVDLIEREGPKFVEPKAGIGLILVVEVLSTTIVSDRVLITTKPFGASSNNVVIEKWASISDSAQKMESRFRAGRMLILATVEEKNGGGFFLRVHDEVAL